MNVFEQFEKGTLLFQGQKIDLGNVAWSPHAAFDGVALKHLVTAEQTDGHFSYHLVRIDPGKKIGLHIHEKQLETHEVIVGEGVCDIEGEEQAYCPGTLSIIPSAKKHEVIASGTGLYLFAKFMPALC